MEWKLLYKLQVVLKRNHTKCAFVHPILFKMITIINNNHPLLSACLSDAVNYTSDIIYLSQQLSESITLFIYIL